MIEGGSVFYRYYYDNNIIYTKVLFEKTNIQSFNTVKGKGLVKKNFLVWTGFKKVVPLDLRSLKTIFEVVIDLENFKCHDYYCHLMKNKYEKPRKWTELTEEFELRENQHLEVYLLPFRVASEPYECSFHYEVLILHPIFKCTII